MVEKMWHEAERVGQTLEVLLDAVKKVVHLLLKTNSKPFGPGRAIFPFMPGHGKSKKKVQKKGSSMVWILKQIGGPWGLLVFVRLFGPKATQSESSRIAGPAMPLGIKTNRTKTQFHISPSPYAPSSSSRPFALVCSRIHPPPQPVVAPVQRRQQRARTSASAAACDVSDKRQGCKLAGSCVGTHMVLQAACSSSHSMSLMYD